MELQYLRVECIDGDSFFSVKAIIDGMRNSWLKAGFELPAVYQEIEDMIDKGENVLKRNAAKFGVIA